MHYSRHKHVENLGGRPPKDSYPLWMRDRQWDFADFLSFWLTTAYGGDQEAFLSETALRPSIEKRDLDALLARDKAPPIELINYLSAIVPPTLASWMGLWNMKLDRQAPRVRLTPSPYHPLQTEWLRRLATGHTLHDVVAQQKEFLDWVVSKIAAGSDEHHPAKLRELAVTLDMPFGQFIGREKSPTRGDYIANKSQQLATLLGSTVYEKSNCKRLAATCWTWRAKNKTTNLPILAQMLRFLRLNQGMTQKEFAAFISLGTTDTHVKALETGALVPNDKILEKYRSALELSDEEVVFLQEARSLAREYSLARIRPKFDVLLERFGTYGLTEGMLLNAYNRRSDVFFQRSDTLIRHIERAMDMYDKGLIRSRRQPSEDEKWLPLFRYLTHQPQSLMRSDDSFFLKEIYAGRKGPQPLSFLNAHKITKTLAQDLGQTDTHVPKEPHPDKMDAEEETAFATWAERTLLRALIHEGLIKGSL